MTNVVSFRPRNTKTAALRWSPKPVAAYRMVNKVKDGGRLLRMVGDFPSSMDIHTWNLLYAISPEITEDGDILVLCATTKIREATFAEIGGTSIRKLMEDLHPAECMGAIADHPDVYKYSDLRGQALVRRARERLAHLSQGTP